MLRLLCLGAACLALALGTGCGGDDDEDTGGGGGGAAATQEAPAETEAATTESETSSGDITVTMKDFAFEPQEVDAKVGQKITWVNEDDAPHNAVSKDGALKTKTFEKGGSDTVTLDEAGTIEYICTVHPQMTGTITVTE